MNMQTVRSQTGRMGAAQLVVSVVVALGWHLTGLSAEPATTFTLDLGSGVKMEFVLIRPGSFQMGSEKGGGSDEKPVHKVTILTPFYLGKYEVTQEQWQAVMGSNPSSFKGPKNPVEMVSWKDCEAFLKKLNEKFPAMGFRLPTEAEWEYACRAGSATEYCYGDDTAGLAKYAWYAANAGGKIHPVGEKKPNAWGLYDMHGNVYEWCRDWYHNDYRGAPVDEVWEKPAGSNRVLCGGYWDSDAYYCRSASRSTLTPGSRNLGIGFRLARTP